MQLFTVCTSVHTPRSYQISLCIYPSHLRPSLSPSQPWQLHTGGAGSQLGREHHSCPLSKRQRKVTHCHTVSTAAMHTAMPMCRYTQSYSHLVCVVCPLQKMEGKELRLKQEYFLCSATLQDIVRRYKTFKSRMGGSPRSSFADFPKKVHIRICVRVLGYVVSLVRAISG